MIESLVGKHIRDIACGSGYSAAVSSSGELFTWGKGNLGQLGHGDSQSQSKPKQVSWNGSVSPFSPAHITVCC